MEPPDKLTIEELEFMLHPSPGDGNPMDAWVAQQFIDILRENEALKAKIDVYERNVIRNLMIDE